MGNLLARAFLFFSCFLLSFFCAGKKKVGPVLMDLVMEQDGVVAGKEFWIGWHIIRDSGWHTYWQHPGDVGVPPSIDWEVPKGFSVGPLLYCSPEKVKMGTIRANGNYGETLFLFKVKCSDNVQVGETFVMEGKASWLTCSRQCLPGFTDLSIEFEVVDRSSFDSVWHPRFEEFRNSIPEKIGEEWQLSATEQNGFITLHMQGKAKNDFARSDRPVFYSYDRIVRSNGNQFFTQKDDLLALRLQRSKWSVKDDGFLSGLIYRKQGWGKGSSSPYSEIRVPIKKIK